ncbi:hypothetical protein RS030_4653 [Cryptosporidium xiaoi]|uniref:Uncharacterized protein n=1 Tax=Cryptosporidium xiaoi TaxID=659607 RepID=A0AAV9Y164_9CRYT
MLSELNISNSSRILLYLSEIDKSEYLIDYVDFSNNEEFTDEFLFIKEENTLIISSKFKEALLVEIYEFIRKHCPDSKDTDYDSKFGSIRTQTILYRFSIVIPLKEAILWDLLTLLMLIEGISPIIWEKKNFIFNTFKMEYNRNYLRFILYEIKLIRATLNTVCKSGDIWNFLETITYEYFKVCGIIGNEKEPKEECILNFHDEFIQKQLNIHDNNYYCWSFVNWIIFTLIPSIGKLKCDGEFQYSENYLNISTKWVIRLLLTQPFNFGGYNTLVNIIECRIKSYVKNNYKTDELIKIAYSKEIMDLLEKIIEAFKESPRNCIPVILHFRYCLFILISSYIRDKEYEILLENEVNWIKEINLSQVTGKKDVMEIKEHIEFLEKELTRYINNIDNYSNIINKLSTIRNNLIDS